MSWRQAPAVLPELVPGMPVDQGRRHPKGERVLTPCDWRDNCSAGVHCSLSKFLVPGCHQKVPIVDAEGGREVHRVAAAEGMLVGERAGRPCEVAVHADEAGRPGRAGGPHSDLRWPLERRPQGEANHAADTE